MKGLVTNRHAESHEPILAPGQIRLSAVRYLNARPLLHGLLHNMSEGRFHVDLHTPSELTRMLIEEETHVALAPIATLAHHGGLELIPEVAIGCDGDVGSVVLFSEVQVEDLDEVIVDSASRTSAILLRLILRHLRPGREPRYVTQNVGQQALGAQSPVRGTRGALVIGDAALESRGSFAHELDLGRAWKDWTGLPFVFAAWLARRDGSNATMTRHDVDQLIASYESGAASIASIAASWSGHNPQSAATYERYLTEQIRYRLDENALAGLREFLDRAAEARLLPPVELSMWADSRARTRATSLPSVDALLERAAHGGRLSYHDAVRLGEEASTHDLGYAADVRRRALHPHGVVTYIVDRNINYTNVCTTSCRFCAFYRPVGHHEGYVLSREQLAEKIRETVDAGGIQILLQGGLNPDLPLSWYEELFQWMKSQFPIALHALSPEEIWHLSRMENLSLEQVLTRLRAAGMDSLPGGGAEVLTDRVRRKIAKAKCTSAEWLECMRVAHHVGMRSTATMMFGTVDTQTDRLAHLFKVRDLQDETGGFTAFICWDYQYEQGTVQRAGETGTVLYLRMQALARLVLDNVHNIQSSWVTQGPAVGQIALRYGANDLGSVMFEENVVSSAGTTFAMDAAEIERHARAAGFRAVRRNMRYEWLTEPS
jgi:cyclic dehypoxanthinyl futalosine synthase